MYILFVSSGLLLTYLFYTCVFSVNKKVKKFDYKEENYEFILDNIMFYKNNECVRTFEYNKEFRVKKSIELNVDFIYDFIVVNYYYNSVNYKYLSESSCITFPIYTKEQIKTYVYTNKIKYAEIKKITPSPSFDNCFLFTITDIINQFVGPNYNFYKDLDCKFKTEHFVNYLTAENYIDNVNKNDIFMILFCDNFNNDYFDYNDYLTWDPNLKL